MTVLHAPTSFQPCASMTRLMVTIDSIEGTELAVLHLDVRIDIWHGLTLLMTDAGDIRGQMN